MIQILSRKYFCEWANGTSFSSNTSDFSKHLKGSVGEKLKFVTRVRAALIAVADSTNQFEIINGNILRRSTGSWIEDGFQPGQSCILLTDYTGVSSNLPCTVEATGTILNISRNEIEFVASIGTAGAKSDHALVCINKFDGLIYNFGIVENSESTNYLSPYTNDLQGYYFGTIDTTTPTEHTMTVAGGTTASKSWKSGDATVKYISSSNPFGLPTPATDYIHEYEITQTFVINPLFLEDFIENFTEETQPENLIGDKTLKHITKYEFRYDLTDPNTSVKIEDTSNLGNVGWFGENYNGLNDIYNISNVAYVDTANNTSVDTLQLSRKTTISGRLNGSGFANTDKVGIYFFWCAPSGVYSAIKPSLQDTFLWDSIISTMVAGAVTTTGTERIKRFELTYISAARIDFEADIEFSEDEITLINPDLLSIVNDRYFIGIQAGNTGATDVSNKLILQADLQEFNINLDIEGLARFSNVRFYSHEMDDTEGGHTDYKGWKQDGFLFASSIFLNKNENANLRNLAIRVSAYNTVTNESFDLQSFNYDLSDIVVVNSTPIHQRLATDTTRGFKLAVDDQFNQVVLVFNPPASGEQEITLKLGLKFDWQSWLKVADADTVFYDSSLDSNGLGKDASRYSMNENYVIRLFIDADIRQDSIISTRYTYMSNNLDIYGWGLEDDDPEEFSALLETFDPDGNDLGGEILENRDTTFKVTWTPQSGSTSLFTNEWAIHRIEKVNATSQNDVDELSSIRDSRVGNLLKPLPGQTYLKITDNGTNFETECLIDYTKLNGSYNLSYRLGRFRTYARYQIARDIKRLTATELLLFNCPDNGVAVTNSLRIATIDTDGIIISEVAIALSALYTYQNWKMEVSTVLTNGMPNFYAVCYTGAATELHEFRFNGTIYTQSNIFTSNIGGSAPCAIRIDTELEPNSRPYIWFGNRDATIGTQRGFKHAYFDGANWQFTNWNCYNSGAPANNMCAHPQDLIHDNSNVYVMNYDNPPQTGQHNEGKIAVYYQNSGDPTDPTDRTNFANYTLVNNIYRNSGDTENVDGIGTVGDLAFSNGFERLEVDSNSNPVFIVVHDVSLGTNGARHFSKIYANIASPTSEADWTIQTPMAITNDSFGNPEALNGYASATIQSSPLQRKNNCHLLIIDANTFITGHQSKPYWVKHIINDWTGTLVNDWFIFTPNDPSFDYTTGNILVQ